MQTPTLEQQRADFSQRRFLAMPLAGTLVWFVIGIIGATQSDYVAVWSVWIGCGSIFYLGAGLSYLTGEKFFTKKPYKNTFDSLFMHSVIMALLVFAIAVPFASADYASIPMTVGILAGLMWGPFSWIVQHPIGVIHAVTRTLGIVAVWYGFPEQRFVLIPAVIVAVYIVTIIVLEYRYRQICAQVQQLA